MNYEAIFREKALQGFDLFAKDYFHFIDIESIKDEIDECCKNDLGEYVSAKQGVKSLKKIFDKYTFIFDNPSLLIKDDQMAIFEMKRYLNTNKGCEFGYLKYRKQHYDEQIGRLYELVLERNMNLLVYKDIVFLEIERKIEFLQNNEHSNEILMKRFFSLEKAKEQRKLWAKKRSLCVCGKEYSKGDKIAHYKTKYHQNFLQEHSKKEFIVGDGENIVLKMEDL